MLFPRCSRKLSYVVLALSGLFAGAVAEVAALEIASPDGRVVVEFQVNAQGEPRYGVRVGGVEVLRESRLGLVREDADFSRGLSVVSESVAEKITDNYELLTAKRRVNTYVSTRQTVVLARADGGRMEVVFQVSHDGVVFRYVFPEADAAVRKLKAEATTFALPAGTRAWLQPIAVAKSGWAKTNPSYEEYYEKDIAAGAPSPTGAGWVYPGLFRTGELWVLLSEGTLDRSYCATRLTTLSPEGEYGIGFPDARENFHGGAVAPESALPWVTPWRIVVVGSLKEVAESTLGLDVATPAKVSAVSGIEPGKASWSWPLLGDRNTTYDVQKRFVDYAAEMGWRYTLIDAQWDQQIGYEKIKELVDYAATKRVRILLWYNSAGAWNDTPQTPRGMLLTRESRLKEFARLQAMGVAGLKIDFFGGDGQSVIGYYLDILDDAAAYGFLVNFHGATLPRGWQRTYPNLMTVEAIRGLEFITFEQKNADQAPTHAAMLPFTRNVFDPMDFTPMVLDRINKIERRTTSGFELALAVLFTSGIQHYAEIPAGMAKVPGYVRDFLKAVPSVWDDTRFLGGFPGKDVVMARRSGSTWYLAGINAEAQEKTLTLDLAELGLTSGGTLITDGADGNLSFREEPVSLVGATPTVLRVTLRPQGGFVAVVR